MRSFPGRYLDTYRQHNPMRQPSNPVRDYKLMQRVEELWTEVRFCTSIYIAHIFIILTF